jgi:hypothetical protein
MTGSTELERRFDELQARLVPLWNSIRELTLDAQTIVVVPSVSLDLVDASHVPMQAYEERMLFMLLLLRQPRARVVYVTSQTILPAVVDYYLDLLPGVDADDARPRLFLVAAHDGSSRPLTRKLLEQPETVAQIRALIVDPRHAHLVPFVGSDLERDLAMQLDIPMYAADSRHARAGTKSGSRQLFAEEGVRHAPGVEGVHGFDEVVDAIASMRNADPSITQVIVKLDEGVSGDGNALVTLGDAADRDAIRAAVDSMQLEADDLTLDRFAARLRDWGGVVEARITGAGFASPSVQMRITPLGELEVLSTHDQLLGGHDGQSYVGCVFPADPAYAYAITEEAAKVGRRLARDGVIGRFAVDFVVVRDADGAWRCDAIEINLRKGGTTHPFLTLQYLTDGRYEPAAATFTAPSGARKCFVASDRVESPSFVGLTPDALFAVAARHGLSFDPASETGIVFHMLASLVDAGRFGMTAVADTIPDAHARFARARAVLEADAASVSEH